MFSFFVNYSYMQNAMFCKESFVFTCLTYKNVQHFRNGPVQKFYGLKASQMSKLCASSHEYLDVDKIKNCPDEATTRNWIVRILQ